MIAVNYFWLLFKYCIFTWKNSCKINLQNHAKISAYCPLGATPKMRKLSESKVFVDK